MIMCKIDDYINNVILYIKKTLDYKMEITDIEKKQLANIPTYSILLLCLLSAKIAETLPLSNYRNR